MADAQIVTATQTAESFLNELNLATPEAEEFRRRMKEKSPCNPIGVEPDRPLKTMDQSFMEIMDTTDPDLKEAFKPLRNELQNAPRPERYWARYSFMKPGQNQTERPFNVFYSLTKKDNIRMTDVQHMVFYDSPYKRTATGYYINNATVGNVVNTDRSITFTQGGIYLILLRLKCRNVVSTLNGQGIELEGSTNPNDDFNFSVSLQLLNPRVGPNIPFCTGDECSVANMPLDLHLKDTNYIGDDIRYSAPVIQSRFTRYDIFNNVTKKFSLSTTLKIQSNERLRLVVERGRLLTNHEIALINEASTGIDSINDTSHNFGSVGLYSSLPDDNVKPRGFEDCNYIEIHRLV